MDREPPQQVDSLIIGAGIMGATMAMRLAEVAPQGRVVLLESQASPALESSAPWHNAGTGHAALCELNYTPQAKDGSITLEKAIHIHSQWLDSLAAWARWQEQGKLSSGFIQDAPHMSFVQGEADVAFLHARFRAMSVHPYFVNMEYSEDPSVIHSWAPLLMEGRTSTLPVAATRSLDGRDVDFGRLTDELLTGSNAELVYNAFVTSIKHTERGWCIRANTPTGVKTYKANFVFVAAGGGTLPLLQAAKLKEVRGFGGFPIAGKFWHTESPVLVPRHGVKVYGQPAVGAPPMSVPHLDARIIEGKESLLFGPFAGFSTKFLRRGSWLDLFRSLKWHNIIPMLFVALTNLSLVKYLIGELLATKKAKANNLKVFFPRVDAHDWTEVIAGQRVQVIKPKGKLRGELQFGTELVITADGSMAGLLGASPGASTAVTIVEEALTGRKMR